MRIAVIGCCNAPGIANCLRALRPGDEVFSLSVDHLAATADPFEKDCDFVFAIANAAEFGLRERLAACRRVIAWPNPVFFGFHPDIVYFGIGERPVRSAMGDYNSYIVASAYGRGASVRATLRLFNRLVYARLGYLDKYAFSRAALIAAAARIDFDLREAMAAWERSGVFMYSINHPKLCVLADIAKMLLRKASLPFDERMCLTDHVPDHLALGGSWPVYPEIARDIGVAGSTTFGPAHHGSLEVSFLTLEGFIEQTFARYEADGFSRGAMADLAGIRAVSEKIAA